MTEVRTGVAISVPFGSFSEAEHAAMKIAAPRPAILNHLFIHATPVDAPILTKRLTI
jgi:hypothetical protein